ncbi:MAG TPA: hypothetical protein VEX43_01870 [Chthoniobacterales bacterium]|nr:hypothetical protein [Chthoniobacterales bacterium]
MSASEHHQPCPRTRRATRINLIEALQHRMKMLLTQRRQGAKWETGDVVFGYAMDPVIALRRG